MSARATATAPQGRTVNIDAIRIEWKGSPFAQAGMPLSEISYGYVGGIRAFALITKGRKTAVRSYLPTGDGKPVGEVQFPERAQAKRYADENLQRFLTSLVNGKKATEKAAETPPAKDAAAS
ncbi:hypothetical protein AB0I81_50615 [Nonomuraea sp. NPDC050404]|uniref:hypothetical protein n=1 Tax=Nonomuraea sp. NPDC050404 TaxID=3155783 RepID=UPI0033EAC9E7